MADLELRREFLQGMSHAACTVNIVTTDGPSGRAGVTVSAMSSISADTPKPTLLVCVHHLSPVAQKILDNRVFCVNVLRDDQSYISDTFAGRFKHKVRDKFDCAEWTTQKTGAPRIVDPLVAFDCTLLSSDRVGTHFVIFGEVESLYVAARGSPLIYANRAYGATSRIEGAASLHEGAGGARRKLSIGCFHTFGPYVLPSLIRKLVETEGGIELHLVEGDQRRVEESLLAGETELALLYDFGISDELSTELLTELQPYVLLAKEHQLADKAEIAPQDLAGQPMVLLNSPPSRDYFQGILRDAGVEPFVVFRSASFEMVRGLVAHGLGYALLGTKPASGMSYDGRALVTRPLSADAKPSRMVLARRADTALSPPARKFQTLCRELLSLSPLQPEPTTHGAS